MVLMVGCLLGSQVPASAHSYYYRSHGYRPYYTYRPAYYYGYYRPYCYDDGAVVYYSGC